MNLTIAQVPALAKTLEPLVNELLVAQAHAKLMRARVDQIVAEVLEEQAYYGTDESGRWSRPPKPPVKIRVRFADYRSFWVSLDEVSQAKFTAVLYGRYQAAGIAPADPEKCPALIAESGVTRAERALVEAAGKVIPELDAERMITLHQQLWRDAVDLYVGLVVNRRGYRPPSRDAKLAAAAELGQ